MSLASHLTILEYDDVWILHDNVWVAKKDTKHSSVLLLCLVSFFETQTLFVMLLYNITALRKQIYYLKKKIDQWEICFLWAS